MQPSPVPPAGNRRRSADKREKRRDRFEKKMRDPRFALHIVAQEAKRVRNDSDRRRSELDAREAQLEKNETDMRQRYVQGGQALLRGQQEVNRKRAKVEVELCEAQRYLDETRMRAAQEDAARVRAQQEAVQKAASAERRRVNELEHARCMEEFHRRHRVSMAEFERCAKARLAKEWSDACAKASRRVAHAAVAAVCARARDTDTLHKAALARLGFAFRAGQAATRAEK